MVGDARAHAHRKGGTRAKRPGWQGRIRTSREGHPLRVLAVCGAAILSLAGGEVVAQTQTQSPPQGGQLPMSPDTTFSFQPKYTSTFNVLKTRETWTQRLSLDERWRNLAFTSNLDSRIDKDESQNDLEGRESKASGTLDYVLGAGRFGLDFGLNRTKRLNTNSSLKETIDEVSATAAFERKLFGNAMLFDWNGLAGYRERSNEGDRLVGTSRQTDDTKQTGPTLGLGTGFTNRSGNAPTVSYAIDLHGDWFWQETAFRQVDTAVANDSITNFQDTVLKAANRTLTMNADAAWAPGDVLNVATNFARTYSSQVRPAPLQGELEDAETDDTSGGLNVSVKPAETVTFRMSASVNETKQGNISPVLNYDTNGSRFTADADFVLLGVDFSSGFEQKSSEQLYRLAKNQTEKTQTDFDSEFIRIRGKGSEDIGPLRISLTGDLALDQRFYGVDPQGVEGALDVDRQSRTTDLTIGYDPSSKLTSRLSFTETRRRTVNLSPERAGNTNTEQRVGVSANYTYTTPWKVSLTQTLTVNAQSRVYDFADADRSDLTRTSILNTRAGFSMFPHTTVSLEHTYNFRNSGQYSRGADGVRRFRLDREYIEQEMALKTAYAPFTWLKLDAEQKLRVVENRTPGLSGIRTPQYDFVVTGSVDKKLLNAVDANLNVTRILSTREENYWRLEMTAGRTFF